MKDHNFPCAAGRKIVETGTLHVEAGAPVSLFYIINTIEDYSQRRKLEGRNVELTLHASVNKLNPCEYSWTLYECEKNGR